MTEPARKLAVVTGASTGIGFELAKQCAEHGHDLIIAANEAAIDRAGRALRAHGIRVDAVNADLATIAGNDKLLGAVAGRPAAALLANAGRGLGKAFLDQNFDDLRAVVETNVTGTLYLIHEIGRDMQVRHAGRILITGSIAGFVPGTHQAVYNGTKAFLDPFSFALRAELKGSGVALTCLTPGATETEFFERADMRDTRIGQAKKNDPAEVARIGFETMMKGETDVVTGWMNKPQTAIASIAPAGVLAGAHRRQAEPGGTANKSRGVSARIRQSHGNSLPCG